MTARVCVFMCAVLLVPSSLRATTGTSEGWTNSWILPPGFRVEVDAQDFRFPTAIAFVPEGQNDPGSPLYFVTELGGRVLVVTRDRRVAVFAEGLIGGSNKKEELPAPQAETGLVGICLAPERGYVFVTLASPDQGGVLRNRIVRFETRPRTFARKPVATWELPGIFGDEVSALAHQIGGCQVEGNHLYVSVGDGFYVPKARDPHSRLGKVLRMTLDGRAIVRTRSERVLSGSSHADYVWALGFRNPFGLKVTGGRIFVADNGGHIDRFLQVREGHDYLWEGSDWSIGARADLIFSPSPGLTHVDWYPESSTVFPPEYRRAFYVGAYSHPDTRAGGIIAIPYDIAQGRATRAPYTLVRQVGGAGFLPIVAVAFGGDGLYFAPILSGSDGTSPILRLTYDAALARQEVSKPANGAALLSRKGCGACHAMREVDNIGRMGPLLDRRTLAARLLQRLESPEYIKSLQEVDLLDTEPQRSYREARREILRHKGGERVRVWLKYRLLEPRFDRAESRMPSLGLSESEAIALADYLMGERGAPVGFVDKLKLTLKGLLPAAVGQRELAYGIAAGMVFGGVLAGVLLWVILRLREGTQGVGGRPRPGRRRAGRTRTVSG